MPAPAGFDRVCRPFSIIPGMKETPVRIFRAAQVRELDRRAIEENDIPGYTLMYRAGEAAFHALRKRWPWARTVLVLCGAGNNAGDGYVLARVAETQGLKVQVVALSDPGKLDGDAAIAFQTYTTAGGTIVEWSPALVDEADVVVDAMLGTGLSRVLAKRPREVVEAVNGAGRPVLALDIPTGLCADTGRVMGAAIRADLTCTFVGLKLGLYTGEGREYAGDIVFDGLGIPEMMTRDVPCAGMRINDTLVRDVLGTRKRTAHKGDFGHVLVIGGGAGYAGAVRLTAEAALRSGAGLVTVATIPAHVPVVLNGRPELMCRGVTEPEALGALLETADVVAVGPGLGTSKWAQSVFSTAIESDRPLVVDADGLNLLARAPRRRDNWVLTPHPGEAGRLLGIASRKVQANRFAAVANILERYGGVLVLKGAGTLVAQVGDVPWLCDCGNPGMAAPGMGDVLTGVIAGIAAQCGELFDAARAGVQVHGAAGDDAASAGGERGLAASDLFAFVQRRVNPS